MFIPTTQESPVKTGDKGSDLGLSLLLGVLERMEEAVGVAWILTSTCVHGKVEQEDQTSTHIAASSQ